MTYDALPQMGIPVHHRDLETVLGTIDGFVRAGRRTGRSHQIVTVNTDFLVQAKRHGDVHTILRTADLALPDGMPIVWASAALGQRLPARIAGADLVTLIAERAAQNGHRVMFFGGADDVGAQAAGLLQAAYPDLVIAAATGMVGPTGETDPELLNEIRGFRPDIICVALGHPKQERWIRRYASDLDIPVAIGVGATFDFIAGERRRAAPWIQRIGFEWLYRLAQEPGRLTQRYMADFAVYIPSIISQIVTTRGRRLPRRAPATPGRPRGWKAGEGIEVVHTDSDTIIVALTHPGSLDYRTAAALTSLATQTRRQGRQLSLVAPGSKACRSLRRLHLDRLIPLVPSAHPPVGDLRDVRADIDQGATASPGGRRATPRYSATQDLR